MSEKNTYEAFVAEGQDLEVLYDFDLDSGVALRSAGHGSRHHYTNDCAKDDPSTDPGVHCSAHIVAVEMASFAPADHNTDLAGFDTGPGADSFGAEGDAHCGFEKVAAAHTDLEAHCLADHILEARACFPPPDNFVVAFGPSAAGDIVEEVAS